MDKMDFKQIFPMGEKNDAFAQYFIGQSYLKMLILFVSTVGLWVTFFCYFCFSGNFCIMLGLQGRTKSLLSHHCFIEKSAASCFQLFLY